MNNQPLFRVARYDSMLDGGAPRTMGTFHSVPVARQVARRIVAEYLDRGYSFSEILPGESWEWFDIGDHNGWNGICIVVECIDGSPLWKYLLDATHDVTSQHGSTMATCPNPLLRLQSNHSYIVCSANGLSLVRNRYGDYPYSIANHDRRLADYPRMIDAFRMFCSMIRQGS